MTPTPPEQAETTDAAELVMRLRALRVERLRIYDCGADEVDVSLTETITMLGHLIAKLSASEAEVARKDRELDQIMGRTQGASYQMGEDVFRYAKRARQEPEGSGE